MDGLQPTTITAVSIARTKTAKRTRIPRFYLMPPPPGAYRRDCNLVCPITRLTVGAQGVGQPVAEHAEGQPRQRERQAGEHDQAG